MAFSEQAFAVSAFQMAGDLTVASPIFEAPVWLWPEAVMSYGIPHQAWHISVAEQQLGVRANEIQVVSASSRRRPFKVN